MGKEGGVTICASHFEKYFLQEKKIFGDQINQLCQNKQRCFTKKVELISLFTIFILDPVFTLQPTSQYTDNIGSPLNITTCKLNSILKASPKQFYWLVNGVEQRLADVTAVDGSNNVMYSPLQLPLTTVKDQGFYQCVFLKPGQVGKMVLSNKANVQFTGIYIF